jgi:hypothetical protein
MNERIKELVDKAGIYIAYDNRAVLNKELEFFAELIVRECLTFCEYQGDRFDEYDSGMTERARIIRESIQEHFGLEEESDEEAHVRIERELAETMRDLGIKEEPTINETLRNRSTYFGNDI